MRALLDWLASCCMSMTRRQAKVFNKIRSFVGKYSAVGQGILTSWELCEKFLASVQFREQSYGFIQLLVPAEQQNRYHGPHVRYLDASNRCAANEAYVRCDVASAGFLLA